MNRLARPLVAVLSGLAMLFLLIQPSAASTGTLNSGHLGMNVSWPLPPTFDLTPGTGPCPGPSLSFDATSSAGNGIHVTLSIHHAFTYAGATYIWTGITGHGSGTIDPATTEFTVGPFSSTIGNLYRESSPGSCTPGLAVCGAVRLNTTAAPLSLQGSFPGGHTISVPDVTGTAVMTGWGGLQAIGCAAPFGGWNGSTLTFTNMSVTFV